MLTKGIEGEATLVGVCEKGVTWTFLSFGCCCECDLDVQRSSSVS